MVEPANLQTLETLIQSVIRISTGAGFVAMLVMLIFGGIKFLTSGGDSKAVQSATMTITWALLGILFLVIAWLILLLIKAFTGVDVTVFSLKTFCVNSTIPGCP